MKNRLVSSVPLALMTLLIAAAAPAMAMEDDMLLDSLDAAADPVFDEAGVDDAALLMEEQSAAYAACLAAIGGTGVGWVLCTAGYVYVIDQCAKDRNRIRRYACYVGA